MIAYQQCIKLCSGSFTVRSFT